MKAMKLNQQRQEIVLFDNDSSREVLKLDREQNVRSYAMTVKNTAWWSNRDMRVVNELVQSGQPVEKVFLEKGFATREKVIDVFITDLPGWLMHSFASESSRAKAHISEYIVRKDDLVITYGFVAEIFSPEFKKAEVGVLEREMVNMPSVILDDLDLSPMQIWEDAVQHARPEAYHIFWFASIVEDIKTRMRSMKKMHQVFT
jgi:hypothetical protein